MIRMHIHSKWLARIAKKRKAKMVVMLGGAYSWYYELNYRLKSEGIRTADLQHGIISSNNHVYNYYPSLLFDKYIINGAPNYYLTYGEWWKSQTNIPFEKKINIGNVFREYEKKKFKRKSETKIVFIGCNRKTEDYIKLAQYVQDNYHEKEVVFRPHPSERYETKLLCERERYSITIDYERNLYDLLAETNILISEVSTVLFEAIGLVKKIVVWNTQLSKYLSPKTPFIKFEEKEDLLKIVYDNYNEDYLIEESDIWKENAFDNFKNFCKEEIIDD